MLLKGQSIAHIYATHADEIKCSKRTLYNYVDQGILRVRNVDLPRKVRYKPRKKKQKTLKINQKYRVGRTYEEFLAFTEKNPELNVVEMDIVEGQKGGKALLTLLLRNCTLMLIFLVDSASQECIINVFNHLGEIIGTEGIKKSFPVILTDNGSEFKDPWSIEQDAYKDARTKIFYCDPHKAYQKARLEKKS